MPQGDKSKYTEKQRRKAEHIEDSYEDRGVPKQEAEARAWATVNKQSGGGERSGGSGREKSETEKRADRKDSAYRAAQSRRGKSQNSGSAKNNSGSTSLTTLTRDELMEKAKQRDVRGRSRMRKDELIQALS
jgi:plasmid stabilization system protein ParE